MTLAQSILDRFRGRREIVASGTIGAFEPAEISGGMTAERLEREHLSGEHCYGFYLLDENSRCYCTCVDFDSKPEKPDPQWKEKAERLFVVLQHCQLSPLVELSQSGSGCHVWLFFSEATEAWVPRAWWRAIARKLEADFVEVYPRQDQLAGKGLGNLVRYPYWNNSCFIDPENDWKPVDGEQALSGIRTTSATDLRMLAFQLGIEELRPEQKATVVEIDGIGELLPLRVHKIVEKPGTLLHRRWSGDMAGLKDASQSGLAMSIAVELVRQYVPTPEIAASLRYWCRKNGASHKGNRDDWINLTVSKAYDFVISRTEQKSIDATTFQRACHSYLDMIETHSEKPLPSGIAELDESIEGILPGEVCVIAARPGHGKSALAFQWLDTASQAGIGGLIISEEMSCTEIGKRRLLSISDVPPTEWVAANVARLRTQVDDYHAFNAPVYLVESCNTIDRVEEVIDQFCSLHGVGLVAVDYLQLLGGRQTDRYEVVTEISRRIKQAARRNNVRLLLLSQLNREVEKRPDRIPMMSDLRESGQIEQDADTILFAQWPWKFEEWADKSEYRIIAAKRRNGPIKHGKITTRFDAERQIFGTLRVIQDCPL